MVCACAGLGPQHLNAGDAGIHAIPSEQVSVKQPIKTIGIIGGVSWASSIEYYRIMNELARDRLGGVSSAQILMYSIEFGEFSKQERLADKGDWTLMTQTILDAAKRLKRGGADFIVIASNTLNSLAPRVEQEVGIPVLHIADAAQAKQFAGKACAPSRCLEPNTRWSSLFTGMVSRGTPRFDFHPAGRAHRTASSRPERRRAGAQNRTDHRGAPLDRWRHVIRTIRFLTVQGALTCRSPETPSPSRWP